MAKKKKKEPVVINRIEIRLTDDGKFTYDSDVIGWALPTFIQLFLAALQATEG